MFGILLALAVLLAAAGVAKIARPAPAAVALRRAGLGAGGRAAVRGAGAVELAAAALVVLPGGRLPAALLALAFGVLAAVSARLVAAGAGRDCGCFGAAGGSLTHWHTALNAAAALTAGAVAWIGPPSLRTALGSPFGELLVAFGLLLGSLLFLAYTALPELARARAQLEAHP